jgi:3-dehydroquinate synthase
MTHRNLQRTPGPRKQSGSLTVEEGLFPRLPRLIRSLVRGERVFLITDSNVRRILGAKVHRSFVLAGIDIVLVEIPPGEMSKSQKILSSIQNQLLLHGINRRSLILALGGGVVGDIAGFAAATVLRGVRYVHVPTSLLAQVDSSIGGKVGINHRIGKNLIGAFHQPTGIFTDPALLHTLPVAEFRNGLAEVVKIAFACDPAFFQWLEKNTAKIRKANRTILKRLVKRSASLKLSIVQRDERDEGIRKILNFGHSIGHALEVASGYTISHGSAVAMGMVVEAGIAVEMGLLKKSDFSRLVRLLGLFGLPTEFPPLKKKSIFLTALSLDKKNSTGAQRFALPRGIGKMVPDVKIQGIDLESMIFRKPNPKSLF